MTPLTNCVVMRTVCPARRTLPSNTAPTLSLCAMVVMSGCSPWKENDDVRAATCSSLRRERELRSSSVRPSENYSCSLSPLIFTNGSTAIECGGGLKFATVAGTVLGAPGLAFGCITRHACQPPKTTTRAPAAATTIQ